MIQYRDMTAGPVEVCRDLCNKLMAHQAQRGTIHPEALAGMNFDNRLKPSFEGAEEKFLLVAFDGETPVGYVFADAEMVPEEARNFLPPRWGLEGGLGFYPPDMPLPAKVGGAEQPLRPARVPGPGGGQGADGPGHGVAPGGARGGVAHRPRLQRQRRRPLL